MQRCNRAFSALDPFREGQKKAPRFLGVNILFFVLFIACMLAYIVVQSVIFSRENTVVLPQTTTTTESLDAPTPLTILPIVVNISTTPCSGGVFGGSVTSSECAALGMNYTWFPVPGVQNKTVIAPMSVCPLRLGQKVTANAVNDDPGAPTTLTTPFATFFQVTDYSAVATCPASIKVYSPLSLDPSVPIFDAALYWNDPLRAYLFSVRVTLLFTIRVDETVNPPVISRTITAASEDLAGGQSSAPIFMVTPGKTYTKIVIRNVVVNKSTVLSLVASIGGAAGLILLGLRLLFMTLQTVINLCGKGTAKAASKGMESLSMQDVETSSAYI